jgi:Trk K+ transport system NAD-binding subunit
MSYNASLRERVRYRIDNFLDRGSGALFLALLIAFLVSLGVIIGLRFLLNLVSPDPHTPFLRQIWLTYLQITDPGNMAQDNETPTAFKVAAIAAGMTGVVIFSALIAFLTTALDQAIAHLKKGHSRVLESGHTLILGWGPRVIEILRELVEANESDEDSVVTILAEEQKEEIDEYLSMNFRDRRNTRVVTRSGHTASLDALERVNAAQAKSAILLATCDAAATYEEKLASDAKVIKTVLALDAYTAATEEFHIVAEVFDPRNRQVVQDISPGHVVVVDAEEILAKIMVQTSRTSGLSVVYAELLSFAGCEMYFHNAPWNGITFGAMQYHFPDGVPIGLRKADGRLLIRPAPETVLEDDDEILIVAEDDSTIEFRRSAVTAPQEEPIPDSQVERFQERLLILGWSPKAPILVSEYADYVLEGSAVDVVIQEPSEKRRAEIESLSAELDSLQVNLIDKNPLDSTDLESLDPLAYNNIIVLPQRPDEEMDAERTDSETIVVLLHLRRMARQQAEQGSPLQTKIITEVLDSANQDLISRAGVNDFLISNRMVSMIFAQLSEEPRILQVYDDLFQEEGSEIYVKPASLYFHELPASCRFADLMARAQKRDGEVCIGYKLKSLEHDADQNFGIKLIPPKDSEVTITADDALVVVAEDDR